MTYEVWNTEARNIVEAFVTEDEALVFVQEAIDERGEGYADTVALIRDDGDEVSTLAMGAELASRARKMLAAASVGA
jgi:hypothetical protein